MESVLTMLQNIIALLTGSIEGIAQAIGTGLSTLVQSILMTGGALSNFGVFMFIFFGISLAIGLSKFVLHWVTSLGKSN